MGRIADRIKSLFSPRRESPPEDVDALRRDFKERYHHFKLLLNANNDALETMAEMEAALNGHDPFGMSFVLSRSTQVATDVWQIIKDLNELAPGKYETLFARFKAIQLDINRHIHRSQSYAEGPPVTPLREISAGLMGQVGGKIANLGEIGNRLNLKIPFGFAANASAYHRFMQHSDLQAKIYRLIQTADVERLDRLYGLSSRIQQLIMDAPLPTDLEADIERHYQLLEAEAGKGVKVAVRSSAVGEDFMDTSFAGQYRSLLNVSGDYLIQAYKEIIAGKYTPPAMTYRLQKGIRDEDVPMCAAFVTMVDAVSSGVIYTQNPVKAGDDRVLINAVWGLPKPVVDGSAATDFFALRRQAPMAIVEKEIPPKDQKFVCYPDEGLCRLDVTGELGQEPSLTDTQALELAAMALKVESHYGIAQDIEWAIDPSGEIVILQSRPLAVTERELSTEVDPDPSSATPDPMLMGGFTASPGAGTGPVFVVRKDADALRFPEGAVLVTEQALPRWATLLSRAGAVITERGSFAGHLANVAREFNVPAVFGVRGAIESLTPDQQVTVDADQSCIYEGTVREALKRAPKRKSVMSGSPVYESLAGASQHIIPLNLLDPDSPSFKPKHCKTFHDITRFCHEKSVHEMFRFGREHHFPERSSKQLHVNRPMQWWVLNLDDGFKAEVDDRYIELSNIDSIPMLALWEGIDFKPWAGPPAPDGKGFMSVLFQATTNPALVPGVRSNYGNRNYFMISRNFCSLSSRFGFHFTTVEALVSERASENYISFQFKGGAADLNRKLKRILFIQDILETHGFRVDIKEDNLIARTEDREMALMESRLRLLGYLLIHTRQLDMVMENDAAVRHYRDMIMADIAELMETRPADPDHPS